MADMKDAVGKLKSVPNDGYKAPKGKLKIEGGFSEGKSDSKKDFKKDTKK